MKTIASNIIVAGLIFFQSCSYELENVEKPDNLIPRDTFELVLEEVMLLESYVRTQKNNVHEFHPIMIKSIEPIFDKYNVDSSRYRSSMNYYAQKQEVLIEICENIENRVQIDAVEAQESQE